MEIGTICWEKMYNHCVSEVISFWGNHILIMILTSILLIIVSNAQSKVEDSQPQNIDDEKDTRWQTWNVNNHSLQDNSCTNKEAWSFTSCDIIIGRLCLQSANMAYVVPSS